MVGIACMPVLRVCNRNLAISRGKVKSENNIEEKDRGENIIMH
jgi:hypothetical protein